MGFMEESDKRFVNLDRKLGLFILAAIAGIVASVVLVGLRWEVFTPKASLHFIASSAKDLKKGTPVLFKGFRIGQVDSISLDDQGFVRAVIHINKKDIKWFHADSAAVLNKEGLIGESQIELTEGSQSAPSINDGDEVKFRKVVSFEENAKELKDRAEVVLKQVGQLTEALSNPQGDFRQSLARINQLTEDLLITRRNVDKLLASLDKGVNNADARIMSLADGIEYDLLPQIKATADHARGTIENTDAISADIKARLPVILKQTDETIAALRSIAEDFKRMSPGLAPMANKSDRLIGDVQGVIDDTKRSWPLNKVVEPPAQKLLELDSYEK